jgi:hypothetical protein
MHDCSHLEAYAVAAKSSDTILIDYLKEEQVLGNSI